MGRKQWWNGLAVAGALALSLAACKQEPELVGSNCMQTDSCVEEQEQPLERIESVDILLVVDSSGSIAEESEALKAELPRMLNAIVTGSAEDTSFPPASSVHVAVVTSDMGSGGAEGIDRCFGLGDDGVFVTPGEAGVTCDVAYPGYLAYDGGPAAIATVETVSCVPLTGSEGCGYEMPLEAGLKALWPASDPGVTFLEGSGHGEGENAGFLRPDSLLVVVVVTDEDDCSAADPRIFIPSDFLEADDPLRDQPLNLRCSENPDALHAPERYIENFEALRPENDNVIFVTIAGVPTELVSEDVRADYDFGSTADVEAYMDFVLADERMQQQVDPDTVTMPGGGNLLPSCQLSDSAKAYPPRRLVEVTKGFGTQGVLGSICHDFGSNTGMIIRAIGTRLAEAAAGPRDAG